PPRRSTDLEKASYQCVVRRRKELLRLESVESRRLQATHRLWFDVVESALPQRSVHRFLTCRCLCAHAIRLIERRATELEVRLSPARCHSQQPLKVAERQEDRGNGDIDG